MGTDIIGTHNATYILIGCWGGGDIPHFPHEEQQEKLHEETDRHQHLLQKTTIWQREQEEKKYPAGYWYCDACWHGNSPKSYECQGPHCGGNQTTTWAGWCIHPPRDRRRDHARSMKAQRRKRHRQGAANRKRAEADATGWKCPRCWHSDGKPLFVLPEHPRCPMCGKLRPSERPW